MIRTATETDLPDVAEIHVASWREAYRGVVPDAMLASRTVQGSLSDWRKTLAKYPGNITVWCQSDGTVAGFCCAGPVTDVARNAPFPFEIYGLHVAPRARRQGIGAALLHDALHRVWRQEKMTSAIVWTFSGLHLSRKFYEREGGVLVKSAVWTVDGTDIPEVAYGWTHLGRAPAKN